MSEHSTCGLQREQARDGRVWRSAFGSAAFEHSGFDVSGERRLELVLSCKRGKSHRATSKRWICVIVSVAASPTRRLRIRLLQSLSTPVDFSFSVDNRAGPLNTCPGAGEPGLVVDDDVTAVGVGGQHHGASDRRRTADKGDDHQQQAAKWHWLTKHRETDVGQNDTRATRT